MQKIYITIVTIIALATYWFMPEVILDKSSRSPAETRNYFAPGTETQAFLENVTPLSDEDQRKILELFESEEMSNVTRVRTNVVDSLPGGALVQITPSFEKDKFFVDVNFTKKGIKNPYIMAETSVQLSIIAQAKYTKIVWSKFYWAEVVNDSQQGSLSAQRLLLKIELEALSRVNYVEYQFGFLNLSKEEFRRYIAARKSELTRKLEEITVEVEELEIKRQHLRSVQASFFEKIEKNKKQLQRLVGDND